MKKKLIYLALVIVVLALAIFRIVDHAPSADLPLNERVEAVFEKGGRLMCHSAEPNLPAYFALPVVGDVMKKDIDEGYRAFDMEPLWNTLQSGKGSFSPVDVAKIEKVALDKEYVEKQSLMFDFKILLGTVTSVLKMKNVTEGGNK